MKTYVKCILCKKSKFQTLCSMPDRMFDLPGNFTFKKCTSCNLVFLDPQPDKKTLRQHYPSKDYVVYQKEGKSGLFRSIREYMIRHAYKPTFLSSILTYLSDASFAIPRYRKGGKILDIGCGTGDILILLKNLGWDVYGIDIEKQAIQLAKSRGFTKLRLGTYKALSHYPDNYFDAIRLYHVIEHIDDPLLCLSLIYKKIKPGGDVLLCTPNFNSLIRKVFGKYWSAYDAPRHLFIFTPQTLEKAAMHYQFKVASVKYTSEYGIVGSMQYLIDELVGRRGHFFNQLLFFLTFLFCRAIYR